MMQLYFLSEIFSADSQQVGGFGPIFFSLARACKRQCFSVFAKALAV
jgi:hypothetical protein